MVRKVCPICDQVMTSAHYCKTCRSFIRHPYIREADYYLNERHPVSEDHCSFHDPWEEEKKQKPVVNRQPQRTVNPNVYGGAKDASEQARRVAAMARGELTKAAKTWKDPGSQARSQTIINGKVMKPQPGTNRMPDPASKKKGMEIPLPIILLFVVLLLNTCGRMF